jgi:hypothetical protein
VIRYEYKTVPAVSPGRAFETHRELKRSEARVARHRAIARIRAHGRAQNHPHALAAQTNLGAVEQNELHRRATDAL